MFSDEFKPKLLELVQDPSPLLLERSIEIGDICQNIKQLISDMFLTMDQNNGVGLAAVQVGVLKKVIVLNIPSAMLNDNTPEYFCEPCVMINASIRKMGRDFMAFDEGCLSFPGVFVSTRRPKKIVIDFIDHDGKKRREKINGGILSVCIQHEIDHTNGIVFTEKKVVQAL